MALRNIQDAKTLTCFCFLDQKLPHPHHHPSCQNKQLLQTLKLHVCIWIWRRKRVFSRWEREWGSWDHRLPLGLVLSFLSLQQQMLKAGEQGFRIEPGAFDGSDEQQCGLHKHGKTSWRNHTQGSGQSQYISHTGAAAASHPLPAAALLTLVITSDLGFQREPPTTCHKISVDRVIQLSSKLDF